MASLASYELCASHVLDVTTAPIFEDNEAGTVTGDTETVSSCDTLGSVERCHVDSDVISDDGRQHMPHEDEFWTPTLHLGEATPTESILASPDAPPSSSGMLGRKRESFMFKKLDHFKLNIPVTAVENTPPSGNDGSLRRVASDVNVQETEELSSELEKASENSEDEDEEEVEEMQMEETPLEHSRIRRLLRLPGADEEISCSLRPHSAPNSTTRRGEDEFASDGAFSPALPAICKPSRAKPGREKKSAKSTARAARRKLVPLRSKSKFSGAKSLPQGVKDVLGMFEDVTSLDAQMALYRFYQQPSQQELTSREDTSKETPEVANRARLEEEWQARIHAVQHERRARVVSEFKRAARRNQRTIFSMGELAHGSKEAKRRASPPPPKKT